MDKLFSFVAGLFISIFPHSAPIIPTITPTPTITLIPTPTVYKSSEKSLKIAAFITLEAKEADMKKLKERIGLDQKTDNRQFILSYAKYLDENPEVFALNEALMEKIMAQRNAPVINNPAPIVNNNPAPVNNSLRCTSNKLGDYTYTNCY